jgi:hypothetical protein
MNNLDGWVILDKHGVIHCTIGCRHHFFGSVQTREAPGVDELARLSRDWPGLAPFTLHEFRVTKRA